LYQPAIVKVWAGLRAPGAIRHCWKRFGKRLCAAPSGQRYIALWRIKKSTLIPVNQFTEHAGGNAGGNHDGTTYCGSFQNCIHGGWRTGNHVVLKKGFEVDLLRVKKTANIVHTKGPGGGVYFYTSILM